MADRSSAGKAAENRIIFHVDVNSAFLSWSALKHLQEEPGSVDLRTIPSAVGGDVKTRHGIITAKSIPAKKYGVKTGEPVVKALQKCPQLVLVPPDHKAYREYSRQFIQILLRFTPLVQQMSVDEAYMDVTDLLVSGIRGDAPFPNARESTLGPDSRGNAPFPGPGEQALSLAQRIRRAVYSELGFTVNVGISVNRLLAKMASDFEKPDRTHTLYPDEIQEKMWPLPIRSLYGCGAAAAERLRLVGIETIGDAARADPGMLQSLLGNKGGEYIWRSANGISSSLVSTQQRQAKSISNEKTLPADVGRDNYEGDGIPVIRSLALKVASRMQKSGLEGQVVTLQVKTSAFQRYSRQLVLSAPTDRADKLQEAALALAGRLLTGADGLFAKDISIRLIGVGVSRLTEKQMHQMDLFEWAEQVEETEKREKAQKEKEEKLGAMLRKINSRYGEGTLEKGMR